MNEKLHFSDIVQEWAMGAEIEYRPYDAKEWFSLDKPFYSHKWNYRIKPQEEVKVYYVMMTAERTIGIPTMSKLPSDNLKLTFTNDILTQAEVIK